MKKHNKFKINFSERKDFDFKDMSLSDCIIANEALKRGINIKYILNRYLELEYDGVKKLSYGSDTTSLPAITKQILCSKTETKEFLNRNGLSVPVGRRFKVNEIEEITSFSKKITGHIVIKPDKSDFGKFVYCKIGKTKIKETVNKIAQKYENLVVEEFIEGQEYRVFITKSGFCAVCMKIPANILGDNKSSVKALIKKKNERNRDGPWTKIKSDNVALECLKQQGISFDSIPKKGQRVFLRYTSNICTGGDSIELTDTAHESVKKIAIKVLDSIPGLTYCGIDLITKDITRDISRNYKIIEVNNMPSLSLHHYPYMGKSQNAGAALIDLLFPETIRN